MLMIMVNFTLVKMQQKVLVLVAKINIFVQKQCLGLGAEFKQLVKATFPEQLCPRGKGTMRFTLCQASTHETMPDHNSVNYVPYTFYKCAGSSMSLANDVTVKMHDTGQKLFFSRSQSTLHCS